MQAEEKSRKHKQTGTTKSKGSSPGGARRRKQKTFRLKLKVVRLYLEERMPSAKIAKEAGISKQTLYRWASLYKKYGEEALKPIACKKKRKKKATGPVREKIVEVKKNNPNFGSRRISDTLRRLFFLKASPETVRRTRGGDARAPRAAPGGASPAAHRTSVCEASPGRGPWDVNEIGRFSSTLQSRLPASLFLL